MRTRRNSKAFTLVEILIVVVILGILAAIVVPQFTNATQDAQAGNIRTQLSSLNSQIELYRARNNAYPDFDSATVWEDMVTAGYIKAKPVNPFNSKFEVHVNAAGSADFGWNWNTTTNLLEASYFDEANGKLTPTVP